MKQIKSATDFLGYLNSTHFKLHKAYEEYYWTSYMGDHSVDQKKDAALAKLDAFKVDVELYSAVCDALQNCNSKERERLMHWKKFFQLYQAPTAVLPIKKKIDELETQMLEARAKRKEGYIDPKTGKFVKASEIKMGSMMRTHDDEAIRKACFDAKEKLAETNVHTYVEYVGLLNQYAAGLGYEDFYAFKIMQEEGMTKKDLSEIFDEIYEKTQYAFADIRTLEKSKKGLRKPWNFGYLMAGDFTKEEDPYFPFEEAVPRWGRSFAAMGVDFKEGTLLLDLLQRDGKYSNGFCRWPDLVHFENKKRIPGSANFTCNVVLGQAGSSSEGYDTLFHEGGHAAHFLNTKQLETCLNHEFAPMSTAWSETQSIFMDTVLSSYEWRSRYAKNAAGDVYPFELQKRKMKRLHMLNPLGLMGIMFVSDFELHVYQEKNLTSEKVIAIAKKMWRKYFDRSVDSLHALNVPHIYSWDSACSYHAYGFADLAVHQWREYFYKKYGHIVDNPNIGKEMEAVWKLGASKTFNEFVILATGKKLSAKPWLADATKSLLNRIRTVKRRADHLQSVMPYSKKVNLKADIKMVSGKKTAATNKKGFGDMASTYAAWLKRQYTNGDSA